MSACSSGDILDALTLRAGHTLDRDIAYGAHLRQKLDLYTPDARERTTPLVVFFYGGRWQAGDKADFRFVGRALASRGIAVAIPDYRLYPEVRWEGFLADAAAALGYLAEREPRLVAAGHSAGAYIAAMLALDGDRRAAAGVPPCAVVGGIGLAGPYDFLPLTEDDIKAVFGPGPAGPETQPITFVDANDPPMLLLTGGDDTTVNPGNSARLAARLEAEGVPATLKTYPGVGHIRIVAALAAPLRFLAPTLDDVGGFIDALPAISGCARR